MKVLLSLTVLSLTLALAHGSCAISPLKPGMKDGKLVMPEGCTDPSDNSFHSFGSQWNSADCMSCTCSESEMNCCSRFGGVAHVTGCIAKADYETCKYVFYKEDNPSELCSIQM